MTEQTSHTVPNTTQFFQEKNQERKKHHVTLATPPNAAQGQGSRREKERATTATRDTHIILSS